MILSTSLRNGINSGAEDASIVAAHMMLAAAHSDLYEITPETPYTQADLNWQNPKSGSSVEMNDHPEFRPAMSGTIDVSGFDTILIGFPIWLAYHKLIQCTQA